MASNFRYCCCRITSLIPFTCVWVEASSVLFSMSYWQFLLILVCVSTKECFGIVCFYILSHSIPEQKNCLRWFKLVLFGCTLQARALTAQSAETDAIRFLVGTQSLKFDNQVRISSHWNFMPYKAGWKESHCFTQSVYSSNSCPPNVPIWF